MSGSDVYRVRQVLEAIAPRLCVTAAESVGADAETIPALQDRLLFFCTSWSVGLENLVLSVNCEEQIVTLLDAVDRVQAKSGLHGGQVGLGWTLEHIRDLLEGEDHDSTAALERALLCQLEQKHWSGQYDLISGLVGHAVYFFERLPRPSARRGLILIAEHLERLAVETDQGVTWFTAPDLLPERQRRVAPEGYYNLGLAHGVPGVLSVLGRLIELGIESDRLRALVEGGVAWIAAYESVCGGTLPSWICHGSAREGQRFDKPSRLAWCYGDLGAALALVDLGRRASLPSAEVLGMKLGRRAARRRVGDAGVVDSCLCHGEAGAGHCFNRLYQASGMPEAREAALYWFEQLFGRFKEQGLEGLWPSERSVPLPAAYRRRIKLALLEGLAGIGLALFASLTPEEPHWDILLLSDVA